MFWSILIRLKIDCRTLQGFAGRCSKSLWSLVSDGKLLGHVTSMPFWSAHEFAIHQYSSKAIGSMCLPTHCPHRFRTPSNKHSNPICHKRHTLAQLPADISQHIPGATMETSPCLRHPQTAWQTERRTSFSGWGLRQWTIVDIFYPFLSRVILVPKPYDSYVFVWICHVSLLLVYHVALQFSTTLHLWPLATSATATSYCTQAPMRLKILAYKGV